MKQTLRPLLALMLTLALLCPPALAAGDSPTLRMETGGGGAVRLTLERLGDRAVSSVQLTMTFSGSCPNPSFTPANSTDGQYSRCRVEESGGQSFVTVYLDSLVSLNQNGTACLGTLNLGQGGAACHSALLTLLDRDLTPSEAKSIPVRSTLSGGSSGGSSDGSSNSSSDSSSGKPSGSEKPEPLHFTDVEQGSWYYDAIRYAYENHLMTGTSGTTFSPDLSTSRGMIVTILYNLAGTPDAGASDFTDVAPGAYYTKAVSWAAGQGVVSGYGDGRFGPDDPITREQAALILRSYARLCGKDVSAQADLSGFADADTISAYAVEAMSWANAWGLINGTTRSTLSPGGTTTRAQAAVLLRSFCENVIKCSRLFDK